MKSFLKNVHKFPYILFIKVTLLLISFLILYIRWYSCFNSLGTSHWGHQCLRWWLHHGYTQTTRSNNFSTKVALTVWLNFYLFKSGTHRISLLLSFNTQFFTSTTNPYRVVISNSIMKSSAPTLGQLLPNSSFSMNGDSISSSSLQDQVLHKSFDGSFPQDVFYFWRISLPRCLSLD